MTQQLMPHGEVTTFVDLVRLYLGDLDDDVRDELTEGLAADLGELVDDRGVTALPDPEEYADELRAAAGLPARTRRRTTRRRLARGRIAGRRLRPADLRALPVGVDRRLDALGRWWACWVGAHRRRRAAYDLAVSLRPAWWVLRGYVAVQLLWLVKNQTWSTAFPFWDRHPGWATVLMAVAVLGSVQVGRGWWPRSAHPAPRLALLGLNALAVVMVPVAIGQAPPRGLDRQLLLEQRDYYTYGVFNDGRMVCNLTPYGADGRLLTGVQLFDDHGRRVSVDCDGGGVDRLAWRQDGRLRHNVFPQLDPVTARTPDRTPASVEPVTPVAASSDSE